MVEVYQKGRRKGGGTHTFFFHIRGENWTILKAYNLLRLIQALLYKIWSPDPEVRINVWEHIYCKLLTWNILYTSCIKLYNLLWYNKYKYIVYHKQRRIKGGGRPPGKLGGRPRRSRILPPSLGKYHKWPLITNVEGKKESPHKIGFHSRLNVDKSTYYI